MAEDVAKPKGGGVLMPALLITVMAIAVGGAFGTLVLSQQSAGDDGGKPLAKSKSKQKQKTKASKKKGDKKKASKEKPAAGEISDVETIVELPKIVTNLDGQSKHWVRLEMSIVSKAKTRPISPITQKRLGQDIMAHMRQSRLSELEGASGLLNLRSDLSELVRIRTQGRAEELIVHGMIVE